MTIPKRFRRLISFFLSFTLLFQTFAPTIALAQEVPLEPTPTSTHETTFIETSSTSPEPSPEPTAQPTLSPSPSDTVSPSVTVTPEATPTPTATPSEANPPLAETPTESTAPTTDPTSAPTPKPLWIEVDGDTIITSEDVGEGIDYRFRDTNLIVRFTKVTNPGKLTIKQIKLTPEQVTAAGALSDIAYDIISDMPNGSFVYDLTLPLPQATTDVDVQFAPSSDKLVESQPVSRTKEVNSNSVTIRDLDHFTIFFVSGGKDKATNGDFCSDLSNQCSFDTDEKESLKFVDGNKLTIMDYGFEPDIVGFWPDSGFASDRFVEFRFRNLNESFGEINNAAIKIVYNTNALDSEATSGAKLEINAPWHILASTTAQIGPALTTADQTYVLPLPDEYLTRQKLNGLKARFSMFGQSTDEDSTLNTSFDQVVLLVNYDDVPPTTTFDPQPPVTNDTTPTLSGNANDTGGSNVGTVEYRVDGGGWLLADPTDGSFDSPDEGFNFTTPELSEGPHQVEARATDSSGNIQTEMLSLSLFSVDTTPPTATISYSTTEPTNGNVTATLVPSEPVTVTNNDGLSRVFSENGSFTFEFVDAAGNTGSVFGEVNNIDKTPPTGNITSPANGVYRNTKPTFKATASDVNGIASVKFQYKPNSIDDFVDLNTDTTPNASGLYQASWSGVTLTNGTTYNLQIVITDGVGNQGTVGGISFLYDTQLPDIFYNDPLGGETVWYKTGPLFDIDFLYDEGGAPLDYAQYRLDGGTYKNIFTADRTSDYVTNWGIVSWLTMAEGLHQLDLRLRDKAGNINTDDYQENESGLKVGKDLTAPSSTATSPNFANSSPVPVSYTAADNYSGVDQVRLWYRFSGGEWIDSELSQSGDSGTFDFFPEDGEGTYEFYTIAIDNVGNSESSPDGADAQTIFDTTKPSSLITSPTNDGTNSIIYANDWDGLIAGTATDNLSGLDHVELSIRRLSDDLYWNGEGWSEAGEGEPRVLATGTSEWTYTLPEPAENSYEIVSHAVDNVGNTENSYKLTVVLDKTIPEVSITLDPVSPDSGNNWYKTEPTITLTATDDKLTDFIEYQWDNTGGTWTVYGVPFKIIGTGSHTLYYRAFDKAGNVSGIGVKNIKYDNSGVTDAPLNISVSPNPTSGQTAKVKWEAAVDNVGIEKYEVNWSLDGTSTSYTDTVGNEIREHEINKLDQEGKWNITVTAFDYADNRKSGSTELTVDRSAPTAPTLRLAGTGTGEATLNWNLVGDAVDHIIWYGNVSGTYLYGARVGNINSFTVRGLGGGDYYFVVKSVDSAGNQSGNSNEVSTLALVGAPGVEPGTSAEGFSPEVRGATTDVDATGSGTPTPEVLGETEGGNNLSLWLILAFVASGGLASWAFFRRR